ncbi:hypothetical protein H0H92_007160 [Tricholoma furcatifolium]|nr:hypothetical protein H0H92_007160 [Tricholoma furcatifolium]
MSSPYMLGIDFGDQFCKVALAKVMPDGRFDKLDVSYLHPPVPSVILFNDDGSVDFGIKAQAAKSPAAIGSLKRLLALAGREPSVDPDLVFPFVLGKTEKGEVGVKVGNAEGQHVVSVIEVLAVFFRQIMNLASSLVDGKITKVVFTIPNWFDNIQLASMTSACQLAGMPLVGLISESAAAHIYYTISRIKPFAAETSHLVVFIDVGHMATAVSVLSHINGKPVATTTLLDTTFGGHDVDMGILLKLDADILGKFDTRMQALVECHKVKEGLINLDMSLQLGLSDLFFSGQELYKLILYLHHIPDLIKEALSKAGFELNQVHKVIITGGSVHMLQIQDSISGMFPAEVIEMLDISFLNIMQNWKY